MWRGAGLERCWHVCGAPVVGASWLDVPAVGVGKGESVEFGGLGCRGVGGEGRCEGVAGCGRVLVVWRVVGRIRVLWCWP